MKTNIPSPTTFSIQSSNYSYTHSLPHSFTLRSDQIISCTSLVLIDIFVLFCSYSIDILNTILCFYFQPSITNSVSLIFDLISNLILIAVIVLLNAGLISLLQMRLCLVRLCQLVSLIRLCVFGSLRLATAIMSYSNFCLISSLTLIVYVVRHPPAFSIHNIIFTSICTFYPISQFTRSQILLVLHIYQLFIGIISYSFPTYQLLLQICFYFHPLCHSCCNSIFCFLSHCLELIEVENFYGFQIEIFLLFHIITNVKIFDLLVYL